MYKSCPLYAIQSKKMLFQILCIENKKWLKKEFVQENIHPYIDRTSKDRLVEAPTPELNKIQKRIKNGLAKCCFPEYVYSGVKGKSYVDNAKNHAGISYLFKIDISAFFPNTSREKVYNFFKNELKTSPDVANILTNFCTSDLCRDLSNKADIETFIKTKKIRCRKHLCTGASPSPLLSYLVNQKMFNEIFALCEKYDIKMTVYVDDVIFSCSKPIELWFRNQILTIVSKYGYNISKNKVKYYLPSEAKKVTGVIIMQDGKFDIPNKLRKKIIERFKTLSEDNNINKLSGCIVAAQQIDKSAYPSITGYIKNYKKNK